jgi:hypothetical protein
MRERERYIQHSLAAKLYSVVEYNVPFLSLVISYVPNAS